MGRALAVCATQVILATDGLNPLFIAIPLFGAFGALVWWMNARLRQQGYDPRRPVPSPMVGTTR